MVRKREVPDRGDLVWLNFSPQSGHEQAGRRPALVVSRKQYNKPSGLALICPITTKEKGYPFEVVLPRKGPVTGVVLADQVRCLDWSTRKIEYICRVDDSVVAEVTARIQALIQ